MDPAILKLEHAMRELSNLTIQQIAVSKATLKQRYTIDDLQERYSCGREAVIAMLKEYGQYPTSAGPGHRVLILLDQVLLIDGILAGRINPKHLRPAHVA